MKRLLMVLPITLTWLGAAGCTIEPEEMQARQPTVEGLAGITAYYEQATAPHRRSVRKPIRDARDRAMRHLAQKADELFVETESWGSDARLDSWTDAGRSAARVAVADLRTSLKDLGSAAARSDLGAVRVQYARVMASYRHVHKTIGTIDE